MRTYISYALIAVASGGIVWVASNWPVASAGASVPVETQMANGGPLIPGLCILSRQAVIDDSKIGKVANDRYRHMRDEVQSHFNAEQASISSEGQLLESQKETLSAADYQKRSRDLAKRLQDFRSDAADAGRALESTRQTVVARISADLRPIINAAYRQQHCGLLEARESILAGNTDMDITPIVVAGLDAKETTIDFKLARAAPAAAVTVQ